MHKLGHKSGVGTHFIGLAEIVSELKYMFKRDMTCIFTSKVMDDKMWKLQYSKIK